MMKKKESKMPFADIFESFEAFAKKITKPYKGVEYKPKIDDGLKLPNNTNSYTWTVSTPTQPNGPAVSIDPDSSSGFYSSGPTFSISTSGTLSIDPNTFISSSAGSTSTMASHPLPPMREHLPELKWIMLMLNRLAEQPNATAMTVLPRYDMVRDFVGSVHEMIGKFDLVIDTQTLGNIRFTNGSRLIVNVEVNHGRGYMLNCAAIYMDPDDELTDVEYLNKWNEHLAPATLTNNELYYFS